MTLPPLPEPFPAGYIAQTEYFYTADQMADYGQKCRNAALQDAEALCNDHVEEIGSFGRRLGKFDHACEGLHSGMTYAKAIREMLK